MAPDSEQPKINWPLLAGLRFLLALIVACDHLPQFIIDGTHDYFRHGAALAAAVPAFFIISGFSIAASFRKEPQDFLRRRFWRIMPVYWVGVLGSLLPFRVFGHHELTFGFSASLRQPGAAESIKDFLMLQPAFAPMPGTNWSLWSVPIEMAFYLVTPLLARLRLRWWSALAAASLSVYAFLPWHIDHAQNLIAYAAMFWGYGLGWIFYHARKDRRIQFALVLLPQLAVWIVMLRSNNIMYGATPVFLLAATLLIRQDRIQLTPRLNSGFNYLGDLSYPLYAIHAPVAWLLAFSNLLILALPALIPCLAVSVAVLHAIDRPLRRLGRSRRPRPVAQENVVLAGECDPG